MYRANVFNPGTPTLCKVVSSVQILNGEKIVGGETIEEDPGPKWKYTLRPVGLEYNDTAYVTGDVIPYDPDNLDEITLVGYNVWELNNTPTTWFGETAATYKGLEFEPCPDGAAVLAFAPPFEMVDSLGAFNKRAPDHAVLFQWANQLAGECE